MNKFYLSKIALVNRLFQRVQFLIKDASSAMPKKEYLLINYLLRKSFSVCLFAYTHNLKK